MTKRMGMRWLAAVIFLLAAMPARAEQWPEHDFFFVRSKMTRAGQALCELDLSLTVDEKIFALVLVENETTAAPLIVNYMNGNPKIALAERVTVAVDGVEVLAFSPTSRSSEPEITALAGPVTEEAAAHAWDTMRDAAKKATWLTVTAASVTARVPANGLQETLADLAECRRQRSL